LLRFDDNWQRLQERVAHTESPPTSEADELSLEANPARSPSPFPNLQITDCLRGRARRFQLVTGGRATCTPSHSMSVFIQN
jgi:hypothetical protein